MSAIITVRIPKELKEKMRKLKGKVNWSEVIRDAISEHIKKLELMEAAQISDEIRERTLLGLYDSMKIIRKDRGKS
ncbi:MAG: ribbon-helix-helix domain-containing protein [Thermoprotei archaeon]|jgi:Arc/MetJ-type ribon-helix-helix transcriptional regulator